MSRQEGKILIIDDDPDVLLTAKMILRGAFHEVITERYPSKLESHLRETAPDVILLDMNFKSGATSGNEGLYWLRRIHEIMPEVPVVMNTAYGDIQLAVECMKEGAIDFLVKPWEKEKLFTTITNVFEISRSRKRIQKLDETRRMLVSDLVNSQRMLGTSPAMEQVRSQIRKVAPTDANVLILGENGTGKELAAKEIHAASARRQETFIAVDLGAITPSLFESELFGHVKGAFTDARESRTGRFELADKGTIFLDEIGNITSDAQAKLLTVLQNRVITRVGDSRPVPVDIRLISATNTPLYERVAENSFREDLIYRINTVEIVLPPLRERKEDIPELANHFLAIYNKKYGKEVVLREGALDLMNNYAWPGNVRELQHAIERAVIMAEKKAISPEDLLLKGNRARVTNLPTLNVEELEQETIRKAIEKHSGNLSQACKELGMGRSTLYRKIEKYNIQV